MRLINVKSYKLQEFQDENEVEYAILSHRWEQEEVLFKDMTGQVNLSRVQKRKGWYKIQQCCQQAHSDGLEYVWVDTCCIDKSSSAELQEAINSMFRWYAKALVCYVYLSDVGVSKSTYRYTDSSYDFSRFTSSKWFQRGWTLQELLAPGTVFFYDVDWIYIGNRKGSCKAISQATQIPARTLAEGLPAVGWRPCVAEIMRWASGRKTTRLEDRAYSLLGLFDVNMPLIVGLSTPYDQTRPILVSGLILACTLLPIYRPIVLPQ